MSQNSIMILQPYWYAGTWVFDDNATQLEKEAFVAGADEIISAMVKEAKVKRAKKGFRLLFSHTPFPDYQVKLQHDGADESKTGNFYLADKYKLRGWLCPALFKYFPEAPKEIYARAETIKR